ncbi:hydroxycinnamic acid degradation regulator [Marinobacterium nitratireducens]|uniref:Hydroxycinnamic acid degradation regulator n=1 Tax=Marinobacterium nitratireducens TaxID=518897 RepID=A0A917ZM95_9GAMM|nr:MarR family transcriptional regulator [Marinobacterium nitratireducens]GGO86967.1 hydroxycinnamic acid degradation regulator [Marinobacterium nitratireducens]
MPETKKTAVTDTSLPAADSNGVLDELIGYALKRAHVHMNRKLVARLGQHDLRPAQFAALVMIEQAPGLTQVDLGSQLSIDPPQVVTLVNKLEKMGLALRIRSKPDRRAYGIYLSKSGEQLLKQLKTDAREVDIDGTASLDEGERAQLLALLKKLYRSDTND